MGSTSSKGLLPSLWQHVSQNSGLTEASGKTLTDFTEAREFLKTVSIMYIDGIIYAYT